VFHPSFSPIFFTLLFHPSFSPALFSRPRRRRDQVEHRRFADFRRGKRGCVVGTRGESGKHVSVLQCTAPYCTILHHVLIPSSQFLLCLFFFCSVSFVILSFASPRWNDVIFLNWCSCCRRLKKDWACNKARGRHRTEGLRYNWAVN
jgi:hypothetical protein